MGACANDCGNGRAGGLVAGSSGKEGWLVWLDSENGREALAALKKNAFDLVFMDVQMPEMDGLEATAAIREREQLSSKHQAAIALTAHAMKGDQERCLAAGMDGYLSKPIRPQELDAILETYVARRSPAYKRNSGLKRRIQRHGPDSKDLFPSLGTLKGPATQRVHSRSAISAAIRFQTIPWARSVPIRFVSRIFLGRSSHAQLSNRAHDCKDHLAGWRWCFSSNRQVASPTFVLGPVFSE